MESIYTLGTSSASHTYGNVASWIKEFLLDYFPKNFFTYTYVDSKIAWKNISEVLGNGDAEFKKRHYPFMIITPRFNPNPSENFLANTPLTINMDNAVSGLRRNTLFPLILDKANQLELAYKINRDRIEFEVELRLKSLSQQLDVYKNLQNQMLWDRPYLVNVALESMIPKSMIEYVGKLAGIDITDSAEDNNQVPLIMRYLNSHSRLPITYKVRNSTAVEEFFAYYRTKLLLDFSDLTLGDSMKKNSVDEYCSLTFRVTAEFNLPGLFALIGTHEKKFHGLKFDAVVSTPASGVEMIPLYTYTNLYDRNDTDTADGFQFYASTIVQTEEENKGKDEIIRMSDIIPLDHMKVLETLIKDNVPPETIFRFRLLRNSTELPLNCDDSVQAPCEWKVDWHRKRIVFHNTDPLITYRIIIYANLVQINQRYGNLQDNLKRDVGSI